jgi:hypothetical protein
MELSLRLIAEIVLSAWLSSALLVAVMLQAASRPSPGYAAPLAEPEDDAYRFGAGASSSVPGPDSLDIAV